MQPLEVPIRRNPYSSIDRSPDGRRQENRNEHACVARAPITKIANIVTGSRVKVSYTPLCDYASQVNLKKDLIGVINGVIDDDDATDVTLQEALHNSALIRPLEESLH